MKINTGLKSMMLQLTAAVIATICTSFLLQRTSYASQRGFANVQRKHSSLPVNSGITMDVFPNVQGISDTIHMNSDSIQMNAFNLHMNAVNLHTNADSPHMNSFTLHMNAAPQKHSINIRQQQMYQENKGLKDYYQNYFYMGVAVSPKSLSGDEGTLIKKQFNSITPENAMKMAVIHPAEDRYSWKDADSIVNFALANQIRIRGHNLCWHEQVPAWMFKGKDGRRVTKKLLLQRLKAHIFKVVQRYKGKIYAWDVVNEAIDDDPRKFLRNSLWNQICGEDFIAKAFEYAHEADPQAQLFYNDYNTERPEKRDRIFRLLKKLKEAGVPVQGIGLQGHWSLFEPEAGALTAAIEKYAALGLKVQITEMDISVYPWEKEKRALRPGEATTFNPQMEKKQADKYAEIFKILRSHRNVITGVTFWNVSDRHTWLDEYPVAGRKNYPLLFDQQLRPKMAYQKVVSF